MGNSLPTQEGRQRASQGKRPSRCVDFCPCMVLIRRHMLRRVHPEVPPIRLIIDIFYRYVAETSSVGERSEERREGRSVSVRVDLGGRRIIKNKQRTTIETESQQYTK